MFMFFGDRFFMTFWMAFFTIFCEFGTQKGTPKYPPQVRRHPPSPPFGALRRRHRSKDVFSSILGRFLVDFRMILETCPLDTGVVFSMISTVTRRHQDADCKRTDRDKTKSAVAESLLAALNIYIYIYILEFEARQRRAQERFRRRAAGSDE